MKTTKPSKALAALTAVFGCAFPLYAASLVSVDMDMLTPGIQSVRFASPGDTFTIGLVLTVDAAGVSSYGISSKFDTGELSLNGSPAAANVPFGGLTPFIAPIENNALGQVYTFNGGTLGLGPASSSFTLGTINFTVVTPVSDLLEDVSLGFFNAGIDGFFDNSGAPVVPIFTGGFVNVVPEPSAATLLLGGGLALRAARRRRARH